MIDALLLDEAQDIDAITAQFVSTQRAEGAAVVLVGDKHQSIYRFEEQPILSIGVSGWTKREFMI